MHQEKEKPRIPPKPVIATKPKIVPPVRVQQKSAQPSQNIRRPTDNAQNIKNVHKTRSEDAQDSIRNNLRTEFDVRNVPVKNVVPIIRNVVSEKNNSYVEMSNIHRNLPQGEHVNIASKNHTRITPSGTQDIRTVKNEAHYNKIYTEQHNRVLTNEFQEVRYVQLGERPYYENRAIIAEQQMYHSINENVPKPVPQFSNQSSAHHTLPHENTLPPNLINDPKRIYFEGRGFSDLAKDGKNSEGHKSIFNEAKNVFKNSKEDDDKKALYSSIDKSEQGTSSSFGEKCDKLYRKTLDAVKTPNSPSTVCCSILSNAAHECIGMINLQKKELNGKMEKIDSLDSNSSDSGGFKDFLQLSPEKNKPPPFPHHQRKISQPEFLNEKKLSEHKPFGHQRKSSQPDFETNSHQLTQEVDNISSNSSYQNIQVSSSYPGGTTQSNNPASAQALVQFLPQTQEKILMHNKQFGSYNKEKTEERREIMKPRPLKNQGQFQQSTKKLEELFAQRLEKEKVLNLKGQNCLHDGQAEFDAEEKMKIQRQMHQKLHADLQQTVKQIQEIQNTEYRLPQNRKWNEVRT